MSTEMKNPYPPEYGYLRIGTPINTIYGKVLHRTKALDMGMLESAGLILTDCNTTSSKTIRGEACDNRDQNASGWSFSAAASAKAWFVDLSINAHFDTSANRATKAAKQHIEAWVVSTGSITLCDNPTENQLLSCAAEDFRNKLTALYKNVDIDQFAALYLDFLNHYGTGFISKLHLRAIGSMAAEASYNSTYKEMQMSAGGGVSVGGTVGAAAVQAEWKKKTSSTNATGQFQASSFGLPDGSPPAKWADNLLSVFSGLQISALGDLPTFQPGFNAPIAAVKAPQIVPKKAVPALLPAVKPGTLAQAIETANYKKWAEEYQKQNPNRPLPSLDDFHQYEQKQRQQLAQDVGDGEADAANPHLVPPQQQRVVRHAHLEHATAPTLLGSVELGSDASELGDYGVAGYEYTPWSEVFPDLATIERALSLSQLQLGKIMLWVSIRSMFAQYLNFCGKFQSWIDEHPAARHHPNDVFFSELASEARIFNSALNAMRDALPDVITAEDPVGTLESKFIEKLKRRKFGMLDHYAYLKDNYHWMKRVPFGAVVALEWKDSYYYQPACDKARRLSKIDHPALEMLRTNAYRLFPIIASDAANKPFFIWVGMAPSDTNAKTWATALHLIDENESNELHLNSLKWTEYDFNRNLSLRNFGLIPATHYAREAIKRVRILPADTLDDSFWKLHKTSDGTQPDGLVLDDNSIISSGLGLNITGSIPGRNIVGRGELFLVPIGYEDVRDVGGIGSGGGPMWIEPSINDIVEGLKALASA